MFRSANPTTRFVAIAILAAASLLTLRAVAQTGLTAQIPAAPAGGIDPSKLPDIQGIHLGMTADAVLAKMKPLYPGISTGSQFGVFTIQAQYMDAPGPHWIANLIGTTNGCAPNGACNDEMRAIFSAPPNKPVLVSLGRNLGFMVGKEPTTDTVKAALFQKYGANPVQMSPTSWVWTSNEQGGPLSPAPPPRQLLSCGATIAAPTTNIRAYVSVPPMSQLDLTQWMALRCNSPGVYVVATFYGNSLNVLLTDTAEDIRDALAGEMYIEKVDAAKLQNIQKDTKKSVPAL